MYYEHRIYEILPGKAPDLHARFANYTHTFFEKHGFRIVFYGEPIFGSTNELHYVVAWESVAEAETKWEAFFADTEWHAVRAETEKDGQLVRRVHCKILKATPYSPKA